VEGTFKLPKQEHCTQETAACLAYLDAGGRLNVWSQSQLAHLARRELAHIFKMPVRKIKVLTPSSAAASDSEAPWAPSPSPSHSR